LQEGETVVDAREGAPEAKVAAEHHYQLGLEWARCQGALFWELRCATSLSGASGSDILVLIAAAPADTNGADDQSVTPQRDATGEDHHAPAVRCVDAKELLARLTIFGELRSLDIEGARRERLVDRDIDAADPGAVHSDMAHQISTDLNALVNEALSLAYHGARARDQNFDIVLERDFDTTARPIELVPQEMTRVLLNLFGNGFYAASEKCRRQPTACARCSK
jgi:hypothetical protein